MLSVINGTQKKDIVSESEKLLAQARMLQDEGKFDIYAQYDFTCKMLRLSQEQTNQVIDTLNNTTQSLEKIVAEYNTLARKYDEVPELLFTSFSLDPAGTLEILLNDIERLMKIEDQSGDAWKWGLRLTFMHRLKIAWKLIFRPAIKAGEN